MEMMDITITELPDGGLRYEADGDIFVVTPRDIDALARAVLDAMLSNDNEKENE